MRPSGRHAHAVALSALLVLGCGGGKPASTSSEISPTAGSAATDGSRAACDAAIAEAAKTGRGDEVFSPEDQKFSADIQDAMTESCATTQWPQMMLMCLSNGTSREELNSCTEMLTPVQRQDMMERVLVVTKKHEAAAKPAAKPAP